MEKSMIKNVGLGVAGGYVSAAVIGHFVKPQYKHHIGIIGAVVGGAIGYYMYTNSHAAAPVVMTAPAAPAPATA